jgi:hypothetical protein
MGLITFNRIFKINSKNKIRDISIAISYHSGMTLKQVCEKHKLSTPERVRQIHGVQLRNVLGLLGCN